MKKRNFILLALLTAFLLVTQLPPLRSSINETYQQINLIVHILDHIKKQYVEDVDQKSIIYGAASGMVSSLDPFSQFMEPDAHKEMKTGTSGKFGGLGIRIALREGWLTVITPLPDTPAYRQGVLPGDRIIKIEGESTQGITLMKAVKQLRGKPKTKVTISIFREGFKEPKDYKITRQIIKIKSLKSTLFSNNVGYIKINEFIEPTVSDLLKALKKLSGKGITSLILDLRNNPGGLLTSAVDVSKVFIGDKKLIVYTYGRAQPRQDFKADTKAPYANLPIAVLVNKGSASGSEIVAGAFQDQGRAVIIGNETFGKGSVQSIIGLEDGSALRLTTAKYYTPLGRSIHRDEKTKKGGIQPHIVIEVPLEIEAKLQAQSQELYAKDKTPESIIEKDSQVKDEVLERAIEILKAQVFLGKNKKT